MVIAEHSTEPCPTMDDCVVRSNDRPFPDKTVLQPLVITLFVEQIRHRTPISSSREKYYTPGILGMVSGCGFKAKADLE